MRKFFMGLVFVVTIISSGNVFASLANYDGFWYAAGPESEGGGPYYPYASRATRGFASSFMVDSSFRVTAMHGSVVGFADSVFEPNPTGHLTFYLYGGTFHGTGPGHDIPNFGNILFESNDYSVPLNGEVLYWHQLGLDFTLTPGEYWIGAIGNATTGGGVTGSLGFGDGPSNVVPEPATYLMFMLGFGAIILASLRGRFLQIS